MKAGKYRDAYKVGTAQLIYDPVSAREDSVDRDTLRYNTACAAVLWAASSGEQRQSAEKRVELRRKAYGLLTDDLVSEA